MNLHCNPSTLRGSVEIPGSKSHTIRAVAIAAAASGESRIREPLESNDTQAAIDAYTALGAAFEQEQGLWRVTGTGGVFQPPVKTIDVRNSGTTLRIALGSCALLESGGATLTGDEQIQRRPAGPLAASLTDLGATVESLNGSGCAPFRVEGTLTGGETTIEAVTSQYVTSLLMCTPLATGDSVIKVPLLNEQPYVGITLDWLKRQGIRVEYENDYSEFRVPGRQSYNPVDRRIPGDFSSATFFLAAGALAGNAVTSLGLDMNDTQGDKAVVDYLRAMGAEVEIAEAGVSVRADTLEGCELDLNATPDALPMMAVAACLARGETRLVNVPQARLKETDRIAVMAEELTKMGADIEERPDGLVIRQSDLKGTIVEGHDDHRVVMSLAIAASQASGETTIIGAEAASVTYPGFVDALQSLGGQVELR
jgi:3-phosphoshikimate 1-carboxyvinyltransferase